MDKIHSANMRVGFHNIEILLKLSPENVKKIFIPANRNDERVLNLIAMAERLSISVERKKSLVQHPEAFLKHEVSLGLSDLKKYEENIHAKNPTFLVIDNVIDPRNLGACIRSAAASNIAGVIINKHHCSPITPVVRQISAGGTEAVQIFTITNLVNTLKHFQKLGYLILGTSEHANIIHTELDLNKPILAVVGSEEDGIRKKTQESCTEMCTLSKNENINSLNVSVATGIMLFEIARQKFN